MNSRTLLASVIVTASLFAGSAAMAQMTNDTMGGNNRSGMQSGQPAMQSGGMDDSRMSTGTTRMKPMKKMRSKKMKRSRSMRMRQMGNDTMNSSSGMSKTGGGRGGNMGGTGM